MNLFGYYSLLMSVGINGAPKSDSDPVKRIQTLGENLTSWTSQHLCFEDRCLKAVTKETGNWSQRIEKVVLRLEDMYHKCGGVPDREGGSSRKRREEDESEDSEDDEDITELISSRYNREDPVKGVGQLTTAVRKWATDYLSECRSAKKTANNGIPMISLRMHKWKVILENGFHKVRKNTEGIKPTPSSWANWYQRKINKAG